jgi:chemotaxis protein methyltransferase CheR
MTPFNVPEPEPVSAAQFARVRNLLERQCGLDFGDSRRTSLLGALRARIQSLRIAGLDAYYERLCDPAGDDEIRSLINLVTITETCFFRDPAQFRMLRHQILPALLAGRGSRGERRLRIWSAGCSSGEEPYSVALTLCDMGLPLTHRDWTCEIVGTDVNTEMIEAASRAMYPARAVRNVEADCLRRYFTPVGSQFQLGGDVTRLVRFEHGSLTRESPFEAGGCDVILCKNVAIYFRPEETRRLVRRLHAALTDGGYLLLGHSESLWGMEQGFTLVEHDGVFCYRKPASPVTTRREESESRPAPRRHQAAGAPGARFVRAGVEAGVEALRDADRPARHQVTLPAGSGIRDPGRGIQSVALPVREELVLQYERCLESFRTGDWAQAEAAVLALMRSSPSFVPAHLLLAGIHAHLGRYAEARERAEHVLRLNDLEPKAHLLLGMVAARAGQQDEAVNALRRALSLDDSLALAYFWLGNLYRDRGDVERACGEHAEAVTRYERRQLDFTEEFAVDLHPVQIVDFCRQSARRLRRSG